MEQCTALQDLSVLNTRPPRGAPHAWPAQVRFLGRSRLLLRLPHRPAEPLSAYGAVRSPRATAPRRES